MLDKFVGIGPIPEFLRKIIMNPRKRNEDIMIPIYNTSIHDDSIGELIEKGKSIKEINEIYKKNKENKCHKDCGLQKIKYISRQDFEALENKGDGLYFIYDETTDFFDIL